jgi:hypothetical protein
MWFGRLLMWRKFCAAVRNSNGNPPRCRSRARGWAALVAQGAGLALLAACGSSPAGPADAQVADVVGADQPALSPDAGGPCPAGELLFEGEYVDWDSTTSNFLGIHMATVTVVGGSAEPATTPPNGRVMLCVPASGSLDLEFTHESYLTTVFAVEPMATTSQPFSVAGLTPARADMLITDELAVARTATAAQVAVAVTGEAAGVELGAAYEGRFTVADRGWSFFANVDSSAGSAALTITAAMGQQCSARATVPVTADQLTFTTVTCQ